MNNLKTTLAVVGLISALLVMSSAFLDESEASDKITICHVTGSETNPFVEITVSVNALTSHEQHGDIIPAPAGGCTNIPPDTWPS